MEYLKWEADSSSAISSATLSYGVSELEAGDTVWEKLTTTNYPDNEMYWLGLATSKDEDMIQRLLEGMHNLDMTF